MCGFGAVPIFIVMEPYSNQNTTADTAPDVSVVKKGFWRKVRMTLGKAPFMEDAVAAYFCAIDRWTPASARAILMSAIAYFVVPTDAVPDFIAGLGFTDDAAVLMMAISAIRGHLKPEHWSRARRVLEGANPHNDRTGATG